MLIIIKKNTVKDEKLCQIIIEVKLSCFDCLGICHFITAQSIRVVAATIYHAKGFEGKYFFW